MAKGGYDYEKEKLLPGDEEDDKQDYEDNKGFEKFELKEMGKTSTSRIHFLEEKSFEGKSRESSLLGELSSEKRKYVQKDYPKMSDSVVVDEISGKLRIRLYGKLDWTNFLKENGNINSGAFSKELKNELGPTKKYIFEKYIEEKEEEEMYRIVGENFPNFESGKYYSVIFQYNEKGIISIELEDQINARSLPLFDENGKINDKLGAKINKSLGKQSSKKGLVFKIKDFGKIEKEEEIKKLEEEKKKKKN